MNWIEINEEMFSELCPDEGEVFLIGDNISDVVGLGKYDAYDDSVHVISINPMEYDTEPTHILRIPKLPLFNESA